VISREDIKIKQGMRSGIDYVEYDMPHETRFTCKGQKWKIKKDSNYEANKEFVLKIISSIAGSLTAKKYLHKECCEILKNISETVMKEANIEYEMNELPNGFQLQGLSVKASVYCSNAASEETLVTIRTSKWTKTTTSMETAINYINKLAREAKC